MSYQAVRAVFTSSRHNGGELLVLLAIAEHADPSGGNSYPSVATLATMARLTTRHVIRILAKLRASGELSIEANAGPHATNRYRIVFAALRPLKPKSPKKLRRPLTSTSVPPPDAGVTPTPMSPLTPVSVTPDAHVATPPTPVSDEPPLNHQEPALKREYAKRSHPADRGTRLPPGWTLPDEYRAFCRIHRPDLDPDAIAARFLDYWLAQPGTKGRKVDWSATWRNWVRREGMNGGSAWSRREAEAAAFMAQWAPSVARRSSANAAPNTAYLPFAERIDDES